MSTFRLPDLGLGLHEAEITAWHVAPGDAIEAGDILVAVETDKAVVEIPSTESGTIHKLHGVVGDIIAVGAPLVDLGRGRPAEPAPALAGRPPTEPLRPAPPPPPAGPSLAGRLPTEPARPIPPSPPAGLVLGPIKASPAVRAEARRLGIDLATLTGSGPAGLVTLGDLERAVALAPDVGLAEPLRGPRRAMARSMIRAHAEMAAATVTDDAVVGHWTKATDVTVALITALLAGWRAEPALNAWFDGPSLSRTLHPSVDVGVAMDTADGLFVPVLRNAERLDETALRAELVRLEAAIAARRATPADFARPTLSLSSFAASGGRYATLIIVPPQVAVLGAGRARQAVVPVRGKAAVRRVLPLSLSFDHRAVTVGEAARFLAAVVRTLEAGPTHLGADAHE
jgi:2-oxoisovalerate dehydrogenase E2 component (dihydrolipoyl transacylase)